METNVSLAKASGMYSVPAPTGASDRKQAQSAGVDIIIDDLGELTEILLEYN